MENEKESILMSTVHERKLALSIFQCNQLLYGTYLEISHSVDGIDGVPTIDKLQRKTIVAVELFGQIRNYILHNLCHFIWNCRIRPMSSTSYLFTFIIELLLFVVKLRCHSLLWRKVIEKLVTAGK